MFKKFDRIKLTENFFYPANTITADTIGTIREIDGDIGIVQYNFENGMGSYAGFPLMSLEAATKADLINLSPERIIPKNYHIGNKFEVNNIAWTIIDINLAVNEMDDRLILIHDDKQIAITRYNLDKQMSYMAFDQIEKTFDEPEMEFTDEISLYKQLSQQISSQTEQEAATEECKAIELNTSVNSVKTQENTEDTEEIKVIIGGFEFTVINGEIILPVVKAGQLPDCMVALGKVQKLLNGVK